MAGRGNYQTLQKEAMENYFSTHPEACLSAEEIYQLLNQEQHIKMGRTTVYRVLGRLCEQKVLRCYTPQGHEGAHYQLNQCTEEHLHIRCERCGAMDHLCCDEIQKFCSHLLMHHGFTMDEGKTTLYGLCGKCREALANEK